ncbi:MAG: HgcAB-like fusion protein [Candidatus Korobacteraceae bacterium]|jgi:ubiquinone/menaquinone biosynthesis C-methylase UbiE/NAD-dependent dihydropyrimidine dehydrogenase PreA subunit
MAFVLMKIFEEAPRRFDRWMNILTLGRLQQVRDQIANNLVRPNATVLEIGCGTGSLLQMLSRRGACATGIDSAPGMIEEAEHRLSEAGLSDKTEVKKLHALQIEDKYQPGTFDQIVSVLAFSEMSDDEIDCLLLQCRKVLKPGGELILADESEPNGFFRRWTYRVYRYMSRLVTYLGLQASEIKKGNIFLKLLYFAIELPLMILAFFVAPPVTHPLHEIERRLECAGFQIEKTQLYLGGALKLVCASLPSGETCNDVAPSAQSVDLRGEARAAGLEPDGLWNYLKTLPKLVILQYVFRSIPYPTPPRLIRIGNPGRKSPVLVTSNYDLTVRRVCRALRSVDCYLLVAPAGGIDVWCAAGGGKFTIDGIISILKTSRIAELVDHRRLVLPQLCANGINLFDVRRRTSWSAVFGPVDATSIPEYLKGRRRTEPMMRVTYNVRERLEMALAMWGSLSLRYTIFPVLIFGIAVAPWFVLIVAVLAVLISLGCFAIPGKTFVQKAGVLFLSISLVIVLSQLLYDGKITSFSLRAVVLLLAAAYLVGSSYPSYTPLWQCGYSKLFYGFPNLRLEIIEENCIGCKLCDQVCPVECFSPTDHKMIFSQPDLCEGCMACLIQCPTDAIINQVADEHQRLSQCQ